MALIGKAVAHGAVTIINAISCGFGAALGVDLKTEALVRLTNELGRIEGHILSDPEENPVLIEKAVNRVLRHFQLDDEFGAYVETTSDIPIARGLKSSSVAANAVTLATVAALGKSVDDLAVVNLGVDAALEARVTITGAFDDACASYFGDIVVTDNYNRKILRQFHPKQGYTVLLYVPPEKSYTAKSNVGGMRLVAGEVKALHRLALLGDYWRALTLNGLIHSTVLGYDTRIALDALAAGATASGLSGTGPAVAAVVPPERVNSVKDSWKRYAGEIVETRINREKAYVVPC